MAKKEKVCVLLTNPPKGSVFRKNHYVWFEESKAKEFISAGYGEEYDAKKGRPVKVTAPEKPKVEKKKDSK